MCGIVGYVSHRQDSNSFLINGLKHLEYRGYDSSGIAIMQKEGIAVYKSRGKVSQLEQLLQNHQVSSSSVAIAHTCWATHGIPSQTNTHPHRFGNVTLVHNGIIENYLELIKFLDHPKLNSETDSEIAAALINHFYQQTHQPEQAILQAIKMIKGSFAFGILFEHNPKLYAIRRSSPLILAINQGENYIASDIPAVLDYTKDYIILPEDTLAILTADQISLFDQNLNPVTYQVEHSTLSKETMQKDGYEHFMLKEIHEEPTVVKNTLLHHYHSILDTIPNLQEYQRIIIVACGSAMYAGMIAKSLIETTARIPVIVDVASEFRYKNPILFPRDLLIAISQSGETADTLAAVELANQHNITTVGIVNVVGSSLSRICTHVLYTLAGPEISVATTKAYTCQVALLSAFALNLAKIHQQIDEEMLQAIYNQIDTFEKHMQMMVQDTQYIKPAKLISRHQNVFFIGRGIDDALTKEASLKLKEISYIHAEAYPAGELKHGTISLIEKDTPVIAISTNPALFEKTLSNIKEVKARGATVILLSTTINDKLKEVVDYTIEITKESIFFQPILSIIPLQLLAYQVANLRGCEIDQPRNLAKSVTVE